uniref:non-specific serine/threonine protein kinase n=1 Tax=Sinocyclocheilus rhinocerous TaxID=307959 RepID=A0A673L3F1_9TELE
MGKFHIHKSSLIANRYIIQQRLGKGSFGTVYLVKDTKAGAAERLFSPIIIHSKIILHFLKMANDHKFCIIQDHWFLEFNNSMIIYNKDLDCRLEELKRTSRTLSEPQVLHYIHQRRILHRDLKAKNIFLRKNIVKIGDFGVSCLLIGSCDLATSFTGTPYYMSPEALSHRGYDSKSDIWSLGCILYEMCCLAQNFLAVVMRIVEGPTPSLPETYSRQLNCLMQRYQKQMLPCSRHKSGPCQPTPPGYICLSHKFFSLTLRDKSMRGERDASQILRALQKKVHLQTLRERSEVQKMSPRERMRLRKLQAADEKVRKLKKCKVIMIEATCRIKTLLNNSEYWLNLCYFFIVSAIPEDPQAAEAFYSVDEFEPCSEEDSDGEEDSPQTLPVRHVDSQLCDCVIFTFNEDLTLCCLNLVHTVIRVFSLSVCRKLGEDVFLEVYDYLKQARQRQESEENIKQTLIQLVERPGDCFEVDQLLYYEELSIYVLLRSACDATSYCKSANTLLELC